MPSTRPADPSNANRYTYAGGDPINRTDPTGQGVLNNLLEGIAFVAGVAGLVTAGPEVGTGLLLLYAFGVELAPVLFYVASVRI